MEQTEEKSWVKAGLTNIRVQAFYIIDKALTEVKLMSLEGFIPKSDHSHKICQYYRRRGLYQIVPLDSGECSELEFYAPSDGLFLYPVII